MRLEILFFLSFLSISGHFFVQCNIVAYGDDQIDQNIMTGGFEKVEEKGKETEEEEEEEIPYIPSTKNDFLQFKYTLPENLLQVPLQLQETLLNFIDLYQEEKRSILPYEVFHQRENQVYNYASMTNKLNVALLFLGFPSTSLPRIKELWFDNLVRTDHLHGLKASSRFQELLHTPSRIQFKHQFHVIETSFHLQSVFTSYLNRLASKKSANHYYLNAWEVDHLLTSLTEKLFENDPIKPDLTFCIINLELLGDNSTDSSSQPAAVSYSYKNGFSKEDMARLKESESIRLLAGQVVRSLPHKSRVIIDDKHSEFTLNADVPSILSSSSSSSSSNELKLGTDKIRESKKFAASLEKTLTSASENSVLSLENRVLSILQNDQKSSVYDSYRHILARDILFSNMQTIYDEADVSTQERPHGVDSCETDLWTGSNGVVFLDVRADEGNLSLSSLLISIVPPVSLNGAPYSSHSHQPLNYNDLLRKSSTTSRTGTDFRPEDSQHEYNSLIHSLQHHQTHCVELLSHLTPACPIVRTLYDISPIATPENRIYDFQQIAKQIHKIIEEGNEENLQYCGLLLLQRTFIDAVLEISINLGDLLQREMKLDHNKEDQEYYNEAINFHNRILSEVLEVSSMFVGKGHFSQLGFSSAALNHAIARFGAMALGLSRQLLSRPILLHEKRVIGNKIQGNLLSWY